MLLLGALLVAGSLYDPHVFPSKGPFFEGWYTRIIAAGGVPPLIALLSSPELDLQANAAGAIQSICFQTEGRSYVREMGAIPAVLPLLSSPSLKVQTRAVGAVRPFSRPPEHGRLLPRFAQHTRPIGSFHR